MTFLNGDTNHLFITFVLVSIEDSRQLSQYPLRAAYYTFA